MQFVKESFIHATPERVFAFHEQPNALALLTPPWEHARIIKQASISEPGSLSIIEAKVGPIKVRWLAQHTTYDPPRLFEDVQIKGPFRRWQHRHLIKKSKDGAILRDEIDYDPPFGFLGRWLAPIVVQRRLDKLFEYRHRVTREWCERQPRS
jgi:ligand-binding SRPBCC domain-containing protein